jgi:hypothetical protein
MSPCPRKEENEVFIIDTVDKEPVWLDVTFAEANKITRKIMIPVLVRERFHPC